MGELPPPTLMTSGISQLANMAALVQTPPPSTAAFPASPPSLVLSDVTAANHRPCSSSSPLSPMRLHSSLSPEFVQQQEMIFAQDPPFALGLHFTADAILNHYLPPLRQKRQFVKGCTISIDDLRPHFNKPIVEVAAEFNVCITLMKKICRTQGIQRWPHRRIKSLVKRLTGLQVMLANAQGAERVKCTAACAKLQQELEAVIENPNNSIKVASDVAPFEIKHRRGLDVNKKHNKKHKTANGGKDLATYMQSDFTTAQEEYWRTYEQHPQPPQDASSSTAIHPHLTIDVPLAGEDFDKPLNSPEDWRFHSLTGSSLANTALFGRSWNHTNLYQSNVLNEAEARIAQAEQCIKLAPLRILKGSATATTTVQVLEI